MNRRLILAIEAVEKTESETEVEVLRSGKKALSSAADWRGGLYLLLD
jgi:hypothetical protein